MKINNQRAVHRIYWLAGGILIGLAAGALAWSVLPGQGAAPEISQPPASEQQVVEEERDYRIAAPEFSLPDENGEIVTLADFRGRPVLINFWASWCPPCREEMTTFENRFQQHAEKGFIVLAVNADDSSDVIHDFREENNISFNLLHDHESKVIQQYAVNALPTSFFIDADGYVVNRHIGLLTGDLLDEYLVQLGIEP